MSIIGNTEAILTHSRISTFFLGKPPTIVNNHLPVQCVIFLQDVGKHGYPLPILGDA